MKFFVYNNVFRETFLLVYNNVFTSIKEGFTSKVDENFEITIILMVKIIPFKSSKLDFVW